MSDTPQAYHSNYTASFRILNFVNLFNTPITTHSQFHFRLMLLVNKKLLNLSSFRTLSQFQFDCPGCHDAVIPVVNWRFWDYIDPFSHSVITTRYWSDATNRCLSIIIIQKVQCKHTHALRIKKPKTQLVTEIAQIDPGLILQNDA